MELFARICGKDSCLWKKISARLWRGLDLPINEGISTAHEWVDEFHENVIASLSTPVIIPLSSAILRNHSRRHLLHKWASFWASFTVETKFTSWNLFVKSVRLGVVVAKQSRWDEINANHIELPSKTLKISIRNSDLESWFNIPSAERLKEGGDVKPWMNSSMSKRTAYFRAKSHRLLV